MPLTRFFGFVLSGLLVITVFSSVSSAQLRNRQPVLRWLGQGFGDGYHQCHRGPNTDYYNPYSAHNSLLQSHANSYLIHDPDSNHFLRSHHDHFVPNSGHATPIPEGIQFESIPGQIIDRTFEPRVPAGSKRGPLPEPDHGPNADENGTVLELNGHAAFLRAPGQTQISPVDASPKRGFPQNWFSP